MRGTPRRLSSRMLLAEQRKTKALELRTNKRMSLRQIAAELGVSHEAVRKMLNSELDRIKVENLESVERMRTEETLALDAMQRAIWDQAVSEIPEFDGAIPYTKDGRVDMHALVTMISGASDNRLKAINTLLKVAKRRAMLHGLDQPQRRVIEGGVTVEVDVRSRIIDRLAEMRDRMTEALPESEGAEIEEAELVERAG